MQLECKKYLYDVSQAALKFSRFIDAKNFKDYATDDLLKSALERQFEVMGEVLNQLSKITSDLVSKVVDYKKIISFRNVLIHGYAEVDDRLVWNIVEIKLPTLLIEVKDIIGVNSNKTS